MAQMTVKTKLRPRWEGRRPSEKKQQTLHDVAKMNEIRGTEYAGSWEKIPVTLSRLE